MQQASEVNTSELAILGRVLEPEKPTFSASAARAILNLDFNDADKDRMRAFRQSPGRDIVAERTGRA